MTLQKKMIKGNCRFKFGFYIAIILSVLGLITFAIAFFTPPLTGPFCKANCFVYPYSDIASRFPRDYFWMYPAILLSICFVLLMAFLHQVAPKKKKLFSLIGLSFGLMSASILIIDFFVQLSVIQPSLLNGEHDGIALLSQFNPHGIFIVLEEIGYIFMSIALLCMVPVFSKVNKLKNAIRLVFISNFALTMISLIMISVFFGLNREYRFEVAAITFNWFALIVTGILLGILLSPSIGYQRKRKLNPHLKMAKKIHTLVCPLEFSGSLDNSLRRFLQNPLRILEPHIAAGMTVLDLGCGPGYFTVEIARILSGSGKVIAADLQDGMLLKVYRKIKGTDLEPVVELFKCQENSIGITEKVDFILAFWMVHEVPDHERLFNELKSTLKPDGKLYIIEPRLHVKEKAFNSMLAQCVNAGFQIETRPKVFFSRTALLNAK